MNPEELNRHIAVYAEMTGKTRKEVLADAIIAALEADPVLMNAAYGIVAFGMQQLLATQQMESAT